MQIRLVSKDMSALILGIGITSVVLAAIAICEDEFIKLAKEMIDLLLRTMSYTSDEIIRIIKFYLV
jgi:hypothetical protein